MVTRTNLQNRAMHLFFKQVADTLTEHGISLDVAIKNLDVRATPESIKDVFRTIGGAKYGISSTAELQTHQVNEIAEDFMKAISQNSGLFVEFPSRFGTPEALERLDKML